MTCLRAKACNRDLPYKIKRQRLSVERFWPKMTKSSRLRQGPAANEYDDGNKPFSYVNGGEMLNVSEPVLERNLLN